MSVSRTQSNGDAALEAPTYHRFEVPALRTREPDRVDALEVRGATIVYAVYENRDRPTLLLVHGGRAHSGWWHPVIAAGLTEHFRVVTFDLSGHGRSDHREDYSPEIWGDEVTAIIEHVAGGRCLVAGHSMGGLVSIVTAARYPSRIAALTLIDSKVRVPTEETGSLLRGIEGKPLRPYPTPEAALAAFRLLPPQPWVNPAAVKHVAELAIGERDGAWRWRFDPGIARRFSDNLIAEHLRRVVCPLELIYGERSSLVSANTVTAISTLTGRPIRGTALPDGYHHVILDQPELTKDAMIAAFTRMAGDQ